MKIGIAADHAGQRLKAAVTEHLRSSAHAVVAYGPEPTPDDDYPLIVRSLAEAVARGDVDRGIFCCGSGIGPAVAANKIAGVRAAVVENEWSARDGVEHVDVNLLTLGERVIGEELAKSIVDAYLSASVQGGRHKRRREQIQDLERGDRTTDAVAMKGLERRAR
ncbi:MAG TPA: RpiB/LacA/LacB family sugar-phosphate isomerase [Candidatus Limnocylindria bacterium]|jgi:ribose 5-phosphate isomerase B|nr:RpiB/LacA/LacB family sugar-phosphate isomerase [Candidatus Limnocylindria bacterium]